MKKRYAGGQVVDCRAHSYVRTVEAACVRDTSRDDALLVAGKNRVLSRIHFT